MKKKIWLFIVLIIIVIGICFAVVYFNTKDSSGSKTQDNTDSIINSFLNKETTKDELTKLTGMENVKPMMVVGKDSDLREKPSDDLINQYDLKEYVETHNTYVADIEDLFLKNTKYKIKDTSVNANGETVQTIEITGFYYEMFYADWIELAMKILKLTEYDFKNLETDTPTQVAFYKAKVKALQIMSDYIKDYENYDETVTVELVYANGKLANPEELGNLLSNLRGAAYKNMDYSNPNILSAFKARVNNYYELAKKNGTLDENNPLNLR